MLVVLLLTAAWLLPAPAAAASTMCRPECVPVVVIGVPGLRWSDVDPATPTLQRLAREGALGALSVKAVPAETCAADGWLTLGAGNRARAAGIAREPCGQDIPAALAPSQRANAEEREGAELGALARVVEESGGCVGAAGAGAALAVAPSVPGEDCLLRLVEAPAVAGAGNQRIVTAVAADRAVAAALPDGGGTVLVVGLSEAPGERTARLHVALAHGAAFPAGALRSASTRRAPYVQLIDVAPTVLDLLALEPPTSMTGQPWQAVGEQPTPAELADVALLAARHKRVTVPFFVVLLAAELVLLLALWRRPRAAEAVALAGVAALGASYLANLVPWWRSSAPLPTLLGVVLAVTAAVIFVVLSATRRWQRQQGEDQRGLLAPAALVCAFTAGVILLDLVTGAHLQMSSVAGYSPLVAGRFAGIGNVAFGVLAAAVLLATAGLTRSAGVVVAVGAVTVAVDGAPPWGSDVGGVLALVPAFALLAMLLSGQRVTLLRLVVAGHAGAAVVTAFALLDWARPERQRTHLGRFVQDVLDGSAGALLRRKADAVLGLLFANPVTALLPLVIAGAVYLVVRPPAALAAAFAQAPAWRAGLVAVGLASAIGFAVNDSGAAVPAMAVVVAAPATLCVVLRARRAGRSPPRC